jgi:DNA polymerase I
MSSRVLLLVDYSNLLYRAYYSSRMIADTKPWIGILRYLDMLRLFGQRVQEKYPGRQLEFIFAGESRKKLKRTQLNETYKSQRKPVEDPIFKSFRQVIAEVLQDCGWKIMSRDGAEADDVIASIAASVESDVVIFSNDRDLRQLLCFPNVAIYQHPGIFYTPQMFLDDYGFDVNDFVYYKALVGDKSDNIPGVLGWGPVKAKTHILEQNWIQMLEKEGQKDEYEASLALVRLDFSLDCPSEGHIMRIQGALPSKIVEDVYCFDAVNEIALAMNRLEEVVCRHS